MFPLRISGYQLGCTSAAVSAKRPVEHAKNIANKGTPHIVQMTSSCRSISVGAAVVDVCDVLAESVVAEEEVLEVGAHVVHLAVAVLASGCAAVRFLFRGYIYT